MYECRSPVITEILDIFIHNTEEKTPKEEEGKEEKAEESGGVTLRTFKR